MGNAAAYCGECQCTDVCQGPSNETEAGEYRVIANKDYLKIREEIIEKRKQGHGPRIVCQTSGRQRLKLDKQELSDSLSPVRI